jgi:hypothetical protein
VSTREKRESERVGVFLNNSLHDLLGGLMQAGIDNLKTGITQSPSDHFCAPIVTVEAGFGDYDPIRSLHQYFSIEGVGTLLFRVAC